MSISGSIELRPARVGMVFSPTDTAIGRAATLATGVWGGQFYPMVDPSDRVAAVQFADRLSVDVFYPVDDLEESKLLADLPGFSWRGRRMWDPFTPGEGLVSDLLSVYWLVEGQHKANTVLPSWDSCDPLASLFTVLWGAYAKGGPIADRFAMFADPIAIGIDEAVPDITGRACPITLTALHVEYRGEPRSAGFVVVDPAEPSDLTLLWNLRASGAEVFPWPHGQEDRFVEAAKAWLRWVSSTERLPTSMSGTGEYLGQYVNVWTRQDSVPIPQRLCALVEEHGVRHHLSPFDDPWGWTGHHPLATDYRRTFSLQVEVGATSVVVPLPSARPGVARGHSSPTPGIVAGEIAVMSETGFATGHTVALPRHRELAPLLDDPYGDHHQFNRPTGPGRAVAVRTDSERVRVPAVWSLAIFDRLLRDAGWKCEQSDNGRFGERLIERLGGIGNQAANQPAVREVLKSAAGSPQGRPFAALVEVAKKHRGPWPTPPFDTPDDLRRYPRGIVYSLLASNVLRPMLQVICPTCANSTQFRPEDLANEIRCEMCLEQFPLGLALGLSGPKMDWVYQLGGNIPEHRLSETLPIMAALSIFARWRIFSRSTPPHVLGLRVARGREKCEIDIAVAVEDGGPPTFLIGEAKSFMGSIDANDLANLSSVQRDLQSKNINCFVVALTMRPKLDPDETAALRRLCEDTSGTPAAHRWRPVLPVVLTKSDLSSPEFTEGHPNKWVGPGQDFADLAIASCRRNLGLVAIDWNGFDDAPPFRFTWTD